MHLSYCLTVNTLKLPHASCLHDSNLICINLFVHAYIINLLSLKYCLVQCKYTSSYFMACTAVPYMHAHMICIRDHINDNSSL